MKVKIIEAGHYYLSKGATVWSESGWKHACSLRKNGDLTVLFVDDVHPKESVHLEEAHLPVIDFNPRPDHIFLESDMVDLGKEVLGVLKVLPRRKRAKEQRGQWYCSGFPLTKDDGRPTCLLLDAGFTLKKHQMGFSHVVNVLPYYYEEQQKSLHRIMTKAIPDLVLETYLFDLDGRFWKI